MYGVVVCPRCHRAKGVSLKQKTTTCQCGHKIDLSVARVYARTSDTRELSKAVAIQSAKLRGGLKEYERAASTPKRVKGILGLVADSAAKAKSREEKVRAVAVGLTARLGSFTAKDFTLVLESMSVPDPEARLGELLESVFIYQPEPGRYRSV